MVAVLIILFALLWVLTRNIRLEKKRERILRNSNLENATIIKYDGRMVKVYDIMTLVSLAGLFVSNGMPNFMEPVASLLFAVSLGMLIIGLPSWLMGKRYLNSLKKMGYQIPWYDKNYDCILENVPRILEKDEPKEYFEEKEQLEWEEQKGYNKRSKIFALIYVCIWICIMSVNVWLCCKWRFNSCMARLAFWTVVDIYWLIRALFYYMQMNNEKYKEDSETDPYRKTRTSPERAISELLIMLLVVCGAKSLITNFMDAAYRGQIDHDRWWMQEVHGIMDLAYRELVLPEEETTALFTPEERNGDWSGTRQQLMEGVDITTWGVPQDVYQKKIAEYLVILSFNELEEHFSATDEDVVLIAKIENGALTLSLSNLKRKADAPLMIESKIPLPEKEN